MTNNCGCGNTGDETVENPEYAMDHKDPFTDEEGAAYANVLASMVENDMVDFNDFAQNEGLTATAIAKLMAQVSNDAKLSTKRRNALSKGTFCGPGRSFPVPDCAHYTAALRLLGRAKVSEATRAKIRSCVEAKGKKMGCTKDK